MYGYRCTDGAFVVSIVLATGVSGAVDMSGSERVDSIAITATTRKQKASAQPGELPYNKWSSQTIVQ